MAEVRVQQIQFADIDNFMYQMYSPKAMSKSTFFKQKQTNS